jgi:3-(3-hydroxy-phenyl)propionate hydroxylase
VEPVDLYDIVVVGFGPAGEVAAATLGIGGHRVAVFERQRELYPLPRMVTFDGEACRTVQATGKSIDEALSTAVVLESCAFGDADADPLLTLDWRGVQGGFQAHYSIFQPDVEQTLRDRVAELPNVEVNFGVEVVALEQHEDHVELSVRPKGSTDEAELRTVRTKYLIGADGTNSTVRRAAGMEMHDYDMHERWLNFDMNVLRPLPEKFNKLIMIMDPKRPHMYMPLGTTRQRFEMRVDDSETDEQMHDPEVAWTFLKDNHGLDESYLSICRQVVYHYYTRVAADWRKGRVFIAGDAAHTMTPYMGQGGCSAIRDGRNIAWKLDLVLRGVAEDSLLDEYQTEREPHVSALVFTSHHLAEVVNIIDAEKAAERNYAMRNGLTPPPAPFPKLDHGVVHQSPGEGQAEVTGSLAPQGRLRRLGTEGRGDDVIGHGFQLVVRRRPDLDDAQRGALAAIGCALLVLEDASDPAYAEDLDGVYTGFLDRHGVDGYLMRPDWYVFGVAAHERIPGLVSELAALLRLTETARSSVAPA